MNDKNQINILKRNDIDLKEEKPKSNKPSKAKLTQISVSGSKPKTQVLKKEVKKLSFKDIIFNIINFIVKIPTYFTKFLNTSGKHVYYAILGTMVSFCFSILLFPKHPGLFSVFFLTIFLAPFVIKEININILLMGRTKKVEEKGVSLTKIKIKEEDSFNITDFYEENKKILSTYFSFFLGIMLVVISLIVFMPKEYSSQLFSHQGWENTLMPTKDIGFEGTDKLSIFFDILRNNFSVMFICFVVALIFPLGALLMIVWNAMYWAVSFTQFAVFYSFNYNVNLLVILLPLLLSVALHTIIEAVCYFFAAMAGSTLSIGFQKEKLDSDRFFYIFKYCIVLLIFALFFLLLGSVVEVFVFDILKRFFFSFF